MSSNDSSVLQITFGIVIILVLIVIALFIYFLPCLIAGFRGNKYTGSIFILNLFAGWTGMLWLAALVWAMWPVENSPADPVPGDVTETGDRDAGHVMNEMDKANGQRNGTAPLSERLEELLYLKKKGILTDAEYELKRKFIMEE